MVGAIIISICAASLVAGYMFVVNYFLQQDEHFYSQDDVAPEITREGRRGGSSARTHAHA